MERIFIVLAVLLATQTVGAQETSGRQLIPKATGKTRPTTKKDVPKQKYRKGSYLIRNKSVKFKVDVRSDFERRRDFEVTRHFGRMAQLDVIASLAVKNGESSIADRVERIRRIEKKRYREVLRKLRFASRYVSVMGTK